MRSTAAALLPQRADARSPQLVLAPRGRCAPAGRPPALSDCQPRPPDFVAGELYERFGMRLVFCFGNVLIPRASCMSSPGKARRRPAIPAWKRVKGLLALRIPP